MINRIEELHGVNVFFHFMYGLCFVCGRTWIKFEIRVCLLLAIRRIVFCRKIDINACYNNDDKNK